MGRNRWVELAEIFGRFFIMCADVDWHDSPRQVSLTVFRELRSLISHWLKKTQRIIIGRRAPKLMI